MLWVLIRSAWQGASNENHNICFCGEIRKIPLLLHSKKHLIWSYGTVTMQPDYLYIIKNFRVFFVCLFFLFFFCGEWGWALCAFFLFVCFCLFVCFLLFFCLFFSWKNLWWDCLFHMLWDHIFRKNKSQSKTLHVKTTVPVSIWLIWFFLYLCQISSLYCFLSAAYGLYSTNMEMGCSCWMDPKRQTVDSAAWNFS